MAALIGKILNGEKLTVYPRKTLNTYTNKHIHLISNLTLKNEIWREQERLKGQKARAMSHRLQDS